MKVNLRPYLNYLGITSVPSATYQISKQLVNWFQRIRVLKVFTMNRHGGHVGHVTETVFPQPEEALNKSLLQLAQWLFRRCLILS